MVDPMYHDFGHACSTPNGCGMCNCTLSHVLMAYTYHEIKYPNAMELAAITFSLIVHSTPISSSGVSYDQLNW